MTKIDTSTEAVETLLDGVTDGPWHVSIDDDGNPLSGRPSVQAAEELDCGIVHWDGFVQRFWRSARGDKEIQANARFIATSRELVPALLAERDALKAKLAKAVEAARELMDAFYINGNVTERHYRACQAGVKLETTLAELTGGKDE